MRAFLVLLAVAAVAAAVVAAPGATAGSDSRLVARQSGPVGAACANGTECASTCCQASLCATCDKCSPCSTCLAASLPVDPAACWATTSRRKTTTKRRKTTTKRRKTTTRRKKTTTRRRITTKAGLTGVLVNQGPLWSTLPQSWCYEVLLVRTDAQNNLYCEANAPGTGCNFRPPSHRSFNPLTTASSWWLIPPALYLPPNMGRPEGRTEDWAVLAYYDTHRDSCAPHCPMWPKAAILHNGPGEGC